MTRMMAAGGLSLLLVTALSGCAPPGYYPAYPSYYPPPAYQRAPASPATRPQSRQPGSDWVNPEPVR
jgi:hypothetical protein